MNDLATARPWKVIRLSPRAYALGARLGGDGWTIFGHLVLDGTTREERDATADLIEAAVNSQSPGSPVAST